jgi:hypothetical protein
MREPLQLWMIANTHEDDTVPKSLSSGQLVKSYVKTLLVTKRLYPEDVRFLRRSLVPLMVPHPGRYSNIITAEELEQAGQNLLERVFSEGYYSTGEQINEPFQRLADAQIVESRTQGIDSVVLFKYERFYDHFLGEYVYGRIPEWYTDPIDAYYTLFQSIKEYPYIWGVVHRVLYLTLKNKQYEHIKTLAFTEDRRVAHLITSALVEISAERPGIVKKIARSLISSGSQGTRTAKLVAKGIALRTAFQTLDSETLLQGLLSSDQGLRERAVQYVYFLSQTHPDLALNVFEGLIDPVRRLGLPNPSVVRVAFSLGSIFLAENPEDESYKKHLLGIIQRLLRRALYANSRNFVSKLLRTWFLKLVVQSALRMMQLASAARSGASNFEEWKQAFSYSLSEKAVMFEVLPYLDYRHGTWDEIADLLPRVRSLQNQLFNVVSFFAIQPRGALDPDGALPIVKQLYELDKGGNRERIDAIYLWRDILEYQRNVKDTWLLAQKNFVKRCIEENVSDYGILRTDYGRYQYYPLMFYASIWNRIHPRQEVDLIVHFLEEAEKNENRELLIHIIDGFGDKRFRLIDYRGPLRSLIPYVKNKDNEVKEHLVSMLARIYGTYPEQISHFLLEADASRGLREAVRQRSLTEAMPDLYSRGNLFFRDALLNLSPEAIQTVIQVLEEALRLERFSDAVELIIKNLLNELGGGGVFAN